MRMTVIAPEHVLIDVRCHICKRKTRALMTRDTDAGALTDMGCKRHGFVASVGLNLGPEMNTWGKANDR